ncbi:MAG: hypothetical protein JNN20_07410 [Betaproteobacteria bacterium]|nr:hypothetical protein [Betaproteobacteria bacterium]
MARANRHVEAGADAGTWLVRRWGMAEPAAIATLLAAFDGIDVGNDGWLLAEPVNMVADRDRVTMWPSRFLDLDDGEAAALVTSLNTHFAADGLRFHAPTPTRWYVRCEPDDVPVTTPPAKARLAPLADVQPTSTGKINWRSLQNESQMLLFNHPVNETRAQAGKPVVSGVWFWGGGVAAKTQTPPYELVAADAALPRALARQSAIQTTALAWPDIVNVRGNVLAVITSPAEAIDSTNLERWSRELAKLDRDFFTPVSVALASGQIDTLTIYAPDDERTAVLSIRPRDLRFRFWRRDKPIAAYA